MTNYVTTMPDGNQVDLDSVPHTFTWAGGFLTVDTVTYQGNTYAQTFTYSGGNLTAQSGWVKQ